MVDVPVPKRHPKVAAKSRRHFATKKQQQSVRRPLAVTFVYLTETQEECHENDRKLAPIPEVLNTKL